MSKSASEEQMTFYLKRMQDARNRITLNVTTIDTLIVLGSKLLDKVEEMRTSRDKWTQRAKNAEQHVKLLNQEAKRKLSHPTKNTIT